MSEIRTVIFLRHGQTDRILPGAFFGRTDCALNDAGRQAAAGAAARLSRMRVDAVVSSPLVRCVQTARLLHLPGEIQIEPGLNERDFGLWEGKTPTECQKDATAWQAFCSGPDGVPPQGESATQFTERVVEAYNAILDRTEDQKVLLIVTHPSVISTLVSDALGMGPAGAGHFRCAPGSLSSLDYVDGYAVLSRWNA